MCVWRCCTIHSHFGSRPFSCSVNPLQQCAFVLSGILGRVFGATRAHRCATASRAFESGPYQHSREATLAFFLCNDSASSQGEIGSFSARPCPNCADDDPDSTVSATVTCEVCGERDPRFVHVHCCNFTAHQYCLNDGVDVICSYCGEDVRPLFEPEGRAPVFPSGFPPRPESPVFLCCPPTYPHI